MKLLNTPVSLLVALVADVKDCPALPPAEYEFGEPVPLQPGDIPRGCAKYEVIIARGTSEGNSREGDGKFGSVVGDPFMRSVTELLPGVQGYPVQYLADIHSFRGVPQGAHDIISRIASQSNACPDARFALVGYSQGAFVAHRAVDEMPPALQPRVRAVAVFGDPKLRLGGAEFPAWLEARTLQVCIPDDPVCTPGGCLFNHLQYGEADYLMPAVEFIVDALTADAA